VTVAHGHEPNFTPSLRILQAGRVYREQKGPDHSGPFDVQHVITEVGSWG